MDLVMAALADAHCHLDQLADFDQAVGDAQRCGVQRMLSCSEGLSSMRTTLTLAERCRGAIVPGLGLHPALSTHDDDGAVADGLAFLRAHIDRADFVGEVGLDYLHAETTSQRQRQHQILMEQLAVASAAGRPVCLHSRRAERDTLRIAVTCCAEWGIPALLHWFTHSAKLVRLACEAPGVYVSAGPAVLFNPTAMAVAMTVTADRLLLETDSPVPFGGHPAAPSWIPRIARAVASARGMSYDELVVLLDGNLDRFLYSSRTTPRQVHAQGDTRDSQASS